MTQYWELENKRKRDRERDTWMWYDSLNIPITKLIWYPMLLDHNVSLLAQLSRDYFENVETCPLMTQDYIQSDSFTH